MATTDRFDAGTWLALGLGFALTTSTALASVVAAVTAAWALVHPRECAAAWRVSRGEPVVVAMLCLLGAVLIGVPVALHLGHSPWEMLRKHGAFLMLFFVLLALLRPPGRSRALFAGFAGGAALSLALSLLSAASGIPIVQTEVEFADYHVFHDHAQHNVFLALSAFGLATSLLESASRSLPARLGWALVWLAVFDIFRLVQGRTGQVVALMLVAYVVADALRRRRFAIASVACVLAVAAMVPGLAGSQSALQTGIEQIRQDLELYRRGDARTSVGYRLEFHDATLKLIRERPILGHGTGGFAPAYAQYASAQDPPIEPTQNPHSDYLFYWMENGLPGFAAVILVYLAIARSALRAGGMRRAWLGAIGIAWGVSSLANSVLLDRVWTFAFAALLAALTASPPPGSSGRTSR